MGPTDVTTFVDMARKASHMYGTMLHGVKTYNGGFMPLAAIKGNRSCSISLEVANPHEAEAARMGLFSANDNTRDTGGC